MPGVARLHLPAPLLVCAVTFVAACASQGSTAAWTLVSDAGAETSPTSSSAALPPASASPPLPPPSDAGPSTPSGSTAPTAGSSSSGAPTGSPPDGSPAGDADDSSSSAPGASHASVGCPRPNGEVTLGGVDGMDALVDSTATTQFRGCGGSLYIHQVGWGNLPNDQDKRQIAANFAGTGPAHVEMAEATNLQSDIGQFGIAAISEININGTSCAVPPVDDTIGAWTMWVSQFKAQGFGVQSAQYNDTPNCPKANSPPLDWSSSDWNDSRTRAQKGGGVILDAPPSFYYHVLGDDYRAFVKAEIAWANGAGLHSTIIVSGLANGDLLADTQAMVAEFNALPANQQPQEFACENYGAGAPVGRETDPGSVANVALWIINHASTYVP